MNGNILKSAAISSIYCKYERRKKIGKFHITLILSLIISVYITAFLTGCKIIHVETPTKETTELEENIMGEEVDVEWEKDNV